MGEKEHVDLGPDVGRVKASYFEGIAVQGDAISMRAADLPACWRRRRRTFPARKRGRRRRGKCRQNERDGRVIEGEREQDYLDGSGLG